MLDNYSSCNKISLSFAGCGFLGCYYIGVAQCFQQNAPKCLVDNVCGASAGSLVAAAIVCDIDLNQCAHKIEEICIQARNNFLGTFSSKFNINELLRSLLEELLPEDCHIKAKGRLHISVTRLRDSANVMISSFNSKADLIRAILCSCYIPVWTQEDFQEIDGEKYIDGVFSVNQPKLDENTVTVSPFSGSTDISPIDKNSSNCTKDVELFFMKFKKTRENCHRLCHILIASSPEEITDSMSRGFNDALRYLRQTERTECLRCSAVNNNQ